MFSVQNELFSSPANGYQQVGFTCHIRLYELFPPCNQFCFVHSIILATYIFCLKNQIQYVACIENVRGQDYVAQQRQHTNSASLTAVWEGSVA